VKNILRYKNIVISLAIIIVFIFVTKNVVSKYFSTINDLKTKMSDLEKGKLLIERWNIATLYYEKLADAFFSKDPSLFKTFVDQQSRKYNINVSYLSPSRRQEDFYIDSSLNLRASADSYASITSFMKALEEKKITVETLRIRNEGKNRRSVEMSLRTYILE
jgi:hypothetical protein